MFDFYTLSLLKEVFYVPELQKHLILQCLQGKLFIKLSWHRLNVLKEDSWISEIILTQLQFVKILREIYERINDIKSMDQVRSLKLRSFVEERAWQQEILLFSIAESCTT